MREEPVRAEGSSPTGFQTDQTQRQSCEKRRDLFLTKPASQHHLPLLIHPLYLKHLLGNVQTDCCDRHEYPSLLSDGAYLELHRCKNRDGSTPLGHNNTIFSS